MVTDIDSLIVKIKKTEFILEIHESKNTQFSGESLAKKDLKKLLVPILNKNAKGYKIVKLRNKGAKLVIKKVKTNF